MSTYRKITFIVLALLPIIPIIITAFAVYRNGELSTLNDMLTYTSDFLNIESGSALSEALDGWATTISETIGVSGTAVTLTFAYLAYLVFVELTTLVFDVLLWIPRKLKYIIEVNI